MCLKRKSMNSSIACKKAETPKDKYYSRKGHKTKKRQERKMLKNKDTIPLSV